ncbi:Alpha/Beta hydrolase protein [Boletus reticuloceps]|uniref:Carboxypeptidase n=1 Tax=Boletus reticuloceps TaxID=495285 RepID=A0A8I3A7Y8_9AGAM|nr:Alpha/Beta hydrolase protein [Boletus reticuloceps]
MKVNTLLPLVLSGAVVQAVSQSYLTVDNVANAAVPMSLSALSDQSFTTLSHPRFPNHGVRIKKSTGFCDPTVSVYTGYLDVDRGAKHLFFYFFESRRDPAQDDVMMWINGGPGCSSSVGLLFELGMDPRSIMNSFLYVHAGQYFFLDQPVGVGYSYADFGETVETTEDAARNAHAFVTIFFETFNQFSGRRFHLSGESYAGRYLPVFASEIYDQNVIAKAEGRDVINLQSVLIGNGITDVSTLYEGLYDIQCGTSALDVPFQTISNCVKIKAAVCESQDLCYPEDAAIADFLNYPDTRAMLGAESPGNFTMCSDEVGSNFISHLDKWSHHTHDYVAALLERGIRVLIYAGTYDWQCNWVANKLWVDKLDWTGNEAYKKKVWRTWLVNGNAAGETKTSGKLTFASVYGAGHMMSTFSPMSFAHYLTHDSRPA